MAQEIDLIFETLREIKKANSQNCESFERLLISIANKLELIDRNSASAELVKLYLADMTKNTDSKYKVTLDKFSDIEKALKAIFNDQDEHIKTKEMKELFEIFTNNMNTVYSEIRQQKALISGIENKISEISSNKTDKEDILRTISLLRNDFENLNHGYKYTIDTVSNDLKNIINGIVQTDQTGINVQIKEQTETLLKSITDISGLLTSLDKKNEQLEKLLSNVATEEHLKYAQGVIDAIIKKSESIYEKLSDNAQKSDITEVLSATDFIKQKLDESVTKSIFAGIVESSNELIEHVDNIKRQLAVITQNIEDIPDTKFLEESIKTIYDKLNTVENSVNKVDARESLIDIGINIRNLASELSTGKTIVSDILDVVTNKILTSVNEISFEKESYEIKNHVSEMLQALPQKEDIERILDSYQNTQKTLDNLVSQTDKILDKVDNLPTHGDMETLNNNQLSLVENLQEVASKSDVTNITSKIEAVETEVKNINFDKEFESIYDKTSSIENWLSNSNLKESTKDISTEIKKKPNKEDLFKILETMETVINCVEELSQNADAKKVRNTMSEVYRLIEDLKNDFVSTSEMHNDSVIVNLSELQRSVENIVSGDEFNDFIEDLKEFLNKILKEQEQNSENNAAIKEYQKALLNHLETINTAVVQEILGVNENINEVKEKVSSIQDWLTNSKIKENTDELISQIQSKSDKEDVLKVLKVVEAIVGDLSDISQKDSSETVNNTISEVCKQLEDLKTDFISTSEKQNDTVVEHLSEIQGAIENIVHGEDFSNFTEEVKELLDVIVSNTDKINSDYIAIKEYQVAILDKLDSINIQAIQEIVESRSLVVEDTLTTISEYLTTVNKIDTTEIKNSVAEIKKILETKQDSFKEFENNSQETIDILENYLTEIKRILDLSDFAVAENVKNKLIKIEEDLLLYQGQNENALTDIIAKLNEYQEYTKTLDEPYSNQDLKNSMQDISEIKEMIQTLGETYRELKYEDETREKNVAEFVTDRLEDLSLGLENLIEGLETKFQQGFAYNATLIEEKTAALLAYIQDLRHSSSENIDLYERLTVTDSKLMDSKQELELINTDVIEAINSKSDRLIEEFAPIKQMLLKLCSSTEFSKVISEDLTDLHESLNETFNDDSATSKATLSRLDYTYNQISNDLSSIEENLKSFVMTDIDSVIRKMDELQSTVESTFDKIVPPDASAMAEFKNFVDKIEDFKQSQQDFILNVASDIKDKMDTQHEEIKSLLNVSYNNEKIIKAIESLRNSILANASSIREIQLENSDTSLEIDANETSEENKENKPEVVTFNELQSRNDDESIQTRQILAQVRSDYNKFAMIVSELSGENAQIKDILNTIQDKMNNLVVQRTVNNQDITIVEEPQAKHTDTLPTIDEDSNKDIITGKDNFNFIQALDCFKSDVKNLNEEVNNIVTDTEGEKALSEADSQVITNISNKLDKVLKRINSGEWLEEIKSYITNGKIGTTLELILGKLDILALTDSCDWVQDVKLLVNQMKEGALSTTLDPQIGSMIKLLNDKVDILAQSDDYELFEELREILENSNFEQNIETANLLGLINQKLDVLANSDEDFDLDELKEKLFAIEEKIDFLATTGDTENPGFVDDMMYTLLNLEEKIDKFAKNTGSEGIEEFKQQIENLTEKLDLFGKLANTTVASNEVKDKLGLIESKIDVLAMSDSDENIEDVKQKLDLLEAKVDVVASNESYLDLEDIKLSIENVEEKVSAVKKYSESDVKITAILEVINHKIDSLSQNGNEYTQKEFRDIKDLIMAQMDYIDSLENNQKTEAVRKCLKELTVEVNNLNTVQNTKQIQKTIRDMKESIMAAVISVLEQVSFTEESEEIKDFVEEKTDEINQNLVAVTTQLKQLTNAEDTSDYTYSMQDIESDLAKLRLALNDLQVHEQENQSVRLSSILDNINQIGSSVVELQNSIPKNELLGMQLQFDQINSDIESLAALSNQLITTSEETYNNLSSNLQFFGKTITEQLSTRVDKVTKLLEHSNASDAVMRQALIYVGEWIDSASESMNKISTNSDEIIEVKTAIESLKESLPEQTNILSSLEEKFDEQQERLAFFERQITRLLCIEDKFEEQQERIDRLEMTIEKILSAVEDIDDTKVTRKIDKIDKQIAKLSINIEKLASYVD